MNDPERYVRHYRTVGRIEWLISTGKCPVCEMLLISKYHTNCTYLDEKILDN